MLRADIHQTLGILHFRIALPLAAVLLALPPTQVYGQDTGTLEQTAPQPSSKAPEKISVIGSRIKRSQVESSSPTVTIARDKIESSGVATVGELLRTQAVASTGNFSGESGFVRSGAQTSNLYGLGAGRTLVLVDGQRLPKDASLSGTNLNIIPTAMVERVEIMTGSRSAIYGSDAIAGVVNIVTRKDFSGTEVRTSLRTPEHGGGEHAEISAATGLNFANGANLIIAAGGSRENRMYSKNRDISQGQDKFEWGQAYHPPGTYNFRLLDPATNLPLGGEAGLWQPSGSCPAGNRSDLQGPGEPYRGMYCVGKIKEGSSEELTPSTQGAFISSKLSFDLGSDSRISSFLGYTRHLSRSNRGNFFANSNFLTAGRRQVLSPARAASLNLDTQGSGIEIYHVDPAAPDRVTTNLDQSYGGFIELETQLGTGWSTTASVTHYTTRNDRKVVNVINKEQYSKLLHGYSEGPDGQLTLTGNPAYVSIDPQRDTSLLNQMVDEMNAAETNAISAVSVNAGRDILDLPGGALALSIGMDARMENFKQNPDPLDTIFWQNQPLFTGTESTSGSGNRTVSSAYAEFLAPVLPRVNVDFALRFDNYSDFGTASNYNVGAKWDATEAFSLRANAGTSFRSPELNYIHQKGGGGYLSIRDDHWCEVRTKQGNPCVAGETNRIFVDRPGNKDLLPEKARSYVVGAIYEPNQEFYLSADYAAFNIKDVFNLRPIQDVVDDYYTGQPLGPASVNTEATEGYITSMANPWMNIGQELVYLVQVESAVSQQVGPTRLSYKTEATRTISRQEQQTDGSMKQWNGFEDNPKWRWNNTLSADFGSVSASLSSATISEQAPDPENIDTYKASYYNETVPEYTRYDASVDWAFMNSGKVTVGVLNLADKIGGKYRTGNFTGAERSYGSIYSGSWYGRSYFANLTQTF